MRRSFTALALALLAVTAGCSALTGTANPGVQDPQSPNDATNPAAAQATAPDRTVEVAAGGRVQADPDRAVVRVAVTARADSVEAVRRQMAENASRMRSALEGAGLDADQITSARFDIRRNFRHEERPEEPAFQGQHAFVVTLADTDRAGEVVVTAVENGATRVDEVEFTITPETRRELREQALAAAVENARGQAEVAASGAGLELTGVRTVRTAEVSTRPFRRQEVAFATAGGGDGGAATSFEGGKVTVSAQVLVVYNASASA